MLFLRLKQSLTCRPGVVALSTEQIAGLTPGVTVNVIMFLYLTDARMTIYNFCISCNKYFANCATERPLFAKFNRMIGRTYMEQFDLILDQVIIFLIFMAIGFAAVKINLLSKDSLPAISKLFTGIIVPFIIFANTVNGATRADIFDHVYLLLLFVCMFAVLLPITKVLPKIFRIKGDRASLFTMAFSFGNVGLIGIPLILAVFGQRAMIFVAMFSIVDLFILWIYGLSLTYPVENKQRLSFKALKNMINPPLIAIILSVIVIMLGIRIPDIVNRAFITMSNSGLPLPFIYIGGLLASQGIKRFAKFYDLYFGILIKMIIFPICVFIVLRAIGIEPEIVGTVVILFGLPVVGVLPMLADANGSDVEYATAAIIITTLAALFTITLVSYVTSVI